jgi:hypothetical protein
MVNILFYYNIYYLYIIFKRDYTRNSKNNCCRGQCAFTRGILYFYWNHNNIAMESKCDNGFKSVHW